MERAAVPLVLDIMRHSPIEDEARWLASSSLKEQAWGLDNLDARNFTGTGLKDLLAKALQVPVEHQALQLGSWRPFAETERLLTSVPDLSDERDHCQLMKTRRASTAMMAGGWRLRTTSGWTPTLYSRSWSSESG